MDAAAREHDRQQTQSLDYEEDEEQALLGTRRERKFLLKLDACLMTWAWLAYLIKVCSRIDWVSMRTADRPANRLFQLQDSVRIRDEGRRGWPALHGVM